MVALYYQSSSNVLRTRPVLAELVGCLYVLEFGIWPVPFCPTG